MYLIIDTSTKHGAVGLWREGAMARVSAWHSGYHHTAELMPAIDGLLGREGLAPADLRGVAVAMGPGGFSALRTGLSVVKGLALGLSLPVAGVSTLESAAYPYRGVGYPLCALLEAGRELVAWARFQQTARGWRRLSPDQVTSMEVLVAATKRHTLFCGEGVAVYADRLVEAMGARAHLTGEPMPLARLMGLAALGVARLEAGDSDPVASLQPRYLRAPATTVPRPPRSVAYGSPGGRRTA